MSDEEDVSAILDRSTAIAARANAIKDAASSLTSQQLATTRALLNQAHTIMYSITNTNEEP